MRGLSVAAALDSPRAFRAPNAQARDKRRSGKKQERGLNENYGRELMELHTLGVDGGYTQQDVVEVARCFTGWTIRSRSANPEFWFDERLHDPNPKMVLGHKINAGGMQGWRRGARLAGARSAHGASSCRSRSRATSSPIILRTRWWTAWRKPTCKTDGDIRAVLHTMIYSPEFWSREAYRAKIKTPFELVVSAARAVGADVEIAAAAGAVDRAHRRAALSMPAAHRVFGQSRRLGEYRRVAQPAELFARAYEQSAARRDGDVATLLGSGGTNT